MCRTRYKRWCGMRSCVLMPRHVAGKSLRTPFMGVVTYGSGAGFTRSLSGICASPGRLMARNLSSIHWWCLIH